MVPADRPVDSTRRSRAIEAARRAFAADRIEDAARVCDALLAENPRDAEVAMLRFDLHVRWGEYNRAYALITPFVRPGADTDILLRGAFAAAFTARSQPEMKEFCEAFLPWTTRSRPAHILPGRSLRAFRLSASLALAVDARLARQDHTALMYLGLALAEDAANPNAAWMLESIYSERRDFVQALDALCRGRVRMSSPEARDADLRIRELHTVVNAQREPFTSGFRLRNRIQVA